jgi:GxxExxY protein
MDETISRRVIGAAIEVHRHWGPGLLESAYQDCLAYELALRGVTFEQQVHLPIHYKGADLDCGYRMDLVVDRRLVIEIKAQAGILPIHQAQLLTYLRLDGYRVGLLLNFQSTLMKDGILRVLL